MKILTKEEADAHEQASVVGGLKGLAFGSVVSVPLFRTLYKHSNWYRTLPVPLKAFGVVGVVVPSYIIAAETAGRAYEKSMWRGTGKDQLDLKEQLERERWNSLSKASKIEEWAFANQWSIIGGTWLATVGGTLGYVWKSKTLSPMNKIIYARMIAQVAALALMGGAGLLATYRPSPREKAKEEKVMSWQYIAAQQERKDKEAAVLNQASHAANSSAIA